MEPPSNTQRTVGGAAPLRGNPPAIGALLREWRIRRGCSQLDLALDAGISARHLSFVETGRSTPGAEVVLRLTEQLSVPLRERNQLLLAAGYAPVFPDRPLDDAQLEPVRQALDLILTAHEPNPAVVVDRHWNLIAANAAIREWATWVDADLLHGGINVMRVGLHPRGLARRITNLGQVHHYFTERLRRQIAATGDPQLAALLDEVARYPAPPYTADPVADALAGHILTPTIALRVPTGQEVAFFATVATFGTASEVTTSELSIELAYPADRETARLLQKMLSATPGAEGDV